MKRISDKELLKLFVYPSNDPHKNYELKPYEKHPDMSAFTVGSIAEQVAQAQLNADKQEVRELFEKIEKYHIRVLEGDPVTIPAVISDCGYHIPTKDLQALRKETLGEEE